MNESHPVINNPLLSAMLEPLRIVFIVNPNSGTKVQQRIGQSIERYLNHRKFLYSIWHTAYPGHATELAKKAVEEGYQVVVAVGGDGSINEVAAGLVHTEVALGIVPAGSGNGLAMHLGYGRNMDEAIKRLNAAEPVRMDCGFLNGRPFVNMAGVGFDGMVSNLMQGQSFRGFIPYFFQSLKAGLVYQPKDCLLEFDGKVVEERCFVITVANGVMYGYNMSIAPDARIDDGLFSVVVLKDVPKWKYFAAVRSVVTGKIYEEDFVDHYTTSEITIKTAGENYVHFDGEGARYEGDLHFKIEPKCLNVLAPRNGPYYDSAVSS
jgi:YegS/Rv2252/BmrU family lipid kinase